MTVAELIALLQDQPAAYVVDVRITSDQLPTTSGARLSWEGDDFLIDDIAAVIPSMLCDCGHVHALHDDDTPDHDCTVRGCVCARWRQSVPGWVTLELEPGT